MGNRKNRLSLKTVQSLTKSFFLADQDFVGFHLDLIWIWENFENWGHDQGWALDAIAACAEFPELPLPDG